MKSPRTAATSVLDLAIIGAGPAGQATARAAHDHGLRSVVVDEHYPALSSFDRTPTVDRRFGASVMGVLREADATGPVRWRLVLDAAGRADSITANRVVIATGTYDRPVPLPGWTLRGVVTRADADRLIMDRQVVPGQRVILAGNDRSLVGLAEAFAAAGASVVEVALTGSSSRSTTVAIRHRQLLTRVLGTERAEGVQLAAVDGDPRTLDKGRAVPADLVVIGFGSLPRTEIARQLRCDLEWNPACGSWVVVHDALMRTSVDRVYAAGGPCGVVGAERARAEGTLAGLAVVRDARGTAAVGAAELESARRRLEATARRGRCLSESDRRLLLSLVQSDTEVCRCEGVRRSDLDDVFAAATFATSINSAKLYSRAGMGLCQGRCCEATVAALLERASGVGPERLGYFTGQFPTRPVAVGSLIGHDGHERCT